MLQEIENKRKERNAKLSSCTEDSEPLTAQDRAILNDTAEITISKVKSGDLPPSSVISAFIKQTAKAQKELNCVTEPLFTEARALVKDVTLQSPFAGYPISLKDTTNIAGIDSSLGYAKRCGKPAEGDSVLVKMLKDAGAIPIAKTNVPTTMLSFDCTNDVFGTTENPHLKGYCPGGSSGGESALLAFGGSRIGIGTDVAGSVRLPAHFAGIYSLKCSTLRFPKTGCSTSMPGQDGIPACYSPMARSLEDLSFFVKTFFSLKPWLYDYSCLKLPWSSYSAPVKLNIGVVWTDNIVEPSPACARALKLTVDALRDKGHTIIDFTIPDPLTPLRIASQLLLADGGQLVTRELTWCENNDAGVGRALFYMRLPWLLRRAYTLYVRYICNDPIWADLIEGFFEKSVKEYWLLIAEREAYKNKFFNAFNDSGADILLSPVNATPAFPHHGLYNSFSSCGYTFLFNLLDYSAGVLPVTKVIWPLDEVREDFRPQNAIAAGAYMNYDAKKMQGLPVGVQVVGRRLEEEKVLTCMQIVEDALRANGVIYKQLSI